MSRILFVLDIGFDRAGPSVHLLKDIINEGLNRGNVVDVILKDTGGPLSVIPDDFSGVKNLNFFIIKEDYEKKYGFVRRYVNEICYSRKCSKIFLQNGKYDAVFLQSNPVAFFYLRLLKKLHCKIVFNIQDIFPYNLKLSRQLPFAKISFPIFRKLQNMGYNIADKIITISDDMKQTLIEDGVNSGKIEVVYNWSYSDIPIVLDSIEDDKLYDLQMDHSKLNVVYAGNIGRMQNVEIIAKAAQKMVSNSDIHFYIIGSGANKGNIEEMVSTLPNVTILPMQPSQYAESIYAQADINVIPLVPGGIKTALPSKTATILRVNKSIIFCVDYDCKLKSIMKNNSNIMFADTNDPNSLSSAINLHLKKKNGEDKINKVSFPSCFSKKNVAKYIDILTK